MPVSNPPPGELAAKSPVRRLDPDRSLGVRLALASAAAGLILVPFSVLVMLVISAWWPLRRLDESLALSLHEHAQQNQPWVDALSVWTDVFGPWPLRVAVALVAGWLWVRGAKRLAAWAVTTMVAGGLLGILLKLLFGRDRPEFIDPVAHAPGFSFPSGHALNAALASGVLLLAFLPFVRRRPAAKWALWLGAAALTVVTGFSRIALGVHWTSDVLGGWLLGAAVVAATAVAFATWRSRVGRRPANTLSDGVDPDAPAEMSDQSSAG